MTVKIRKQIYLDPEQDAYIKKVSQESGVTEAEVMRLAVDLLRQSKRRVKRDLSGWEAERELIKQLIAQGPVPGKRTWRREDLYER